MQFGRTMDIIVPAEATKVLKYTQQVHFLVSIAANHLARLLSYAVALQNQTSADRPISTAQYLCCYLPAVAIRTQGSHENKRSDRTFWAAPKSTNTAEER